MITKSPSFLDVPDQSDLLHQMPGADADDRPVILPGGTFCAGDDIPLPPGTFHGQDVRRVDERIDVNPPLRTPA